MEVLRIIDHRLPSRSQDLKSWWIRCFWGAGFGNKPNDCRSGLPLGPTVPQWSGSSEALESDRPAFKSQLHHLPAWQPWTSYFASRSFIFFSCKMGIKVVATSQGGREAFLYKVSGTARALGHRELCFSECHRISYSNFWPRKCPPPRR